MTDSSSPIVGRRIIHLGTVGSTMDEAEALAAVGEPEGTVIVADEQTAGRGRAGRSWRAPAGTGVLCSVLLRPSVPPARLGVLPLVAGVAVAESLEAVCGLPCQLKWPNDVWIDERKVAGVLVTARSGSHTIEHAVVGMGVNVNVRWDDLVEGAISLRVATGRDHDRDCVLATLLARLDAGYRTFVASHGTPDLGPWRRRAALLGDDVDVLVGDVSRSGIVRGVDDDGALLLETEPNRAERIYAGEITRGPMRVGTSA